MRMYICVQCQEAISRQASCTEVELLGRQDTAGAPSSSVTLTCEQHEAARVIFLDSGRYIKQDAMHEQNKQTKI